MTRVFGIIKYHHKKKESAIQANCFDNGVLYLKVERMHNFTFDKTPFFYNFKTDVLCMVLGYITNIQEIKRKYDVPHANDNEAIEHIYTLHNFEVLSEMDGIFLILIFDGKSGLVYITQSEMGYNLPFYYTNSESEFAFSTSIKPILKHIPMNRELNIPAVNDMLYCRTLIPSDDTLIKNINKLMPLRTLVINCNRRHMEVKSLLLKKKAHISKTIAKDRLLDSINDNMRRISDQLECGKIAATLTAGWDTNLIFYFLKKMNCEMLSLITIDGGGISSELLAVKNILKNYTSCNHIVSSIDEDIVQSFPDIVWRVEGYSFDEGFFLRYKLSKELRNRQNSTVFLGSSADQLMFTAVKKIRLKLRPLREIYYRMIQGNWREEAIRKTFRRKTHNVARSIFSSNLLLDCNMKLHEIILNSFSIQGVFPFVNRETAYLLKSLGIANTDKKIYKQKVKELLGPEITNNIKKSGNVVDIEQVFKNNKALLTSVMKKDFINIILSEKQIRSINKRPEFFSSLIMQLVYLYLFNELFITKKYDAFFDQSNFNSTLPSMML